MTKQCTVNCKHMATEPGFIQIFSMCSFVVSVLACFYAFFFYWIFRKVQNFCHKDSVFCEIPWTPFSSKFCYFFLLFSVLLKTGDSSWMWPMAAFSPKGPNSSLWYLWESHDKQCAKAPYLVNVKCCARLDFSPLVWGLILLCLLIMPYTPPLASSVPSKTKQKKRKKKDTVFIQKFWILTFNGIRLI